MKSRPLVRCPTKPRFVLLCLGVVLSASCQGLRCRTVPVVAHKQVPEIKVRADVHDEQTEAQRTEDRPRVSIEAAPPHLLNEDLDINITIKNRGKGSLMIDRDHFRLSMHTMCFAPGGNRKPIPVGRNVREAQMARALVDHRYPKLIHVNAGRDCTIAVRVPVGYIFNMPDGFPGIEQWDEEGWMPYYWLGVSVPIVQGRGTSYVSDICLVGVVSADGTNVFVGSIAETNSPPGSKGSIQDAGRSSSTMDTLFRLWESAQGK